MATGDATQGSPGCHVQITAGHRFVEGFGGTPAEALADSRAKLEPYDPTPRTTAG